MPRLFGDNRLGRGANKMKDILYNLALLDTINYCKENNIDCSGTNLWKAGRGYTYVLAKSENGKIGGKSLVSVTFHKSQVPTHIVYK